MAAKASEPAAEKAARPIVTVVSSLRGKAFGLRQPTVVAKCRIPAQGDPDWAQVDALFGTCLPVKQRRFKAGVEFHGALIQRIMSVCTAIQRKAGLPVFELGRVLGWAKAGDELVCNVAMPAMSGRPGFAVDSLRWAAPWAIRAAATPPGELAALETELHEAVEEQVAKLRPGAPHGSNPIRFITAAQTKDIPWDFIANNVFQFGWGVHSRLMDSSILDSTPAIGMKLARDKSGCAQVLRRVGLPVPDHQMASSADQAERIAKKLGYPVVVKPADKDGGVGVLANLGTAAKVRAAYEAASKISNRVMVQKHVPGIDHRLIVFNGQMIWAFKRQAGGVTGDGKSNIAQLVETVNKDPRRGTVVSAALKKLKLDTEALELLGEEGMTPDSVPEEGQFVTLRSAANLSSGGTPTVVFDEVHPDNRRLAEDAARALRLDLAGVDLLIEDVSRSWHETGAYICEINGQPQLGPATQKHLYGAILGEMMPGDGRIPVAVIVGTQAAVDIAMQVQARQLAKGVRIGVATPQGAWIGGRRVLTVEDDLHGTTEMLLSNSQVEAAIVLVNGQGVLKTALPLDRYDALVLASGAELAASDQFVSGIAQMIALNNRGPALINWEDEACQAAAKFVPAAGLQRIGADRQATAATVDGILDARRLNRPSAKAA